MSVDGHVLFMLNGESAQTRSLPADNGNGTTSTFARAIGRQYDDVYDRFGVLDDFFEHSDFLNFGYWEPGTTSARQACEALVDRLVDRLPTRHGLILDAGCGKGATTAHLLRWWPPEETIGINVASSQLETCAANAPGCTFLEMDATQLRFDDGEVGNVISVEAAFHFDTRFDFLREANRVLTPGGGLVMSDILLAPWVSFQPRRNVVPGPHAYRRQLYAAGFEDVIVQNITHRSWIPFVWHLERYLSRRLAHGGLDVLAARALARWVRRMNRGLRGYVLVSARKPDGPTRPRPRYTWSDQDIW